MDLLKVLLQTTQGGTTKQIGDQFGLDQSQTESLLGQLVPALAEGLKNNTQSADGMAGLTKALQNGGHERYLDEPTALKDTSAVQDGNNILGHLFGDKSVSREVAAQASKNTGIDASTIKQMLPLVATMFMGGLSKQTGGGQNVESGLGGLIGGLLGGDSGGGLGNMIGMAAKLLK